MDPVHAAALALLGHPYAKGARLAEREVDCSVFVGAILRSVYPATPWDGVHADLMIRDAARPWSPIDAIEAAGVGSEEPALVLGRWHLCQGWRGLKRGRVVSSSRGHAWLWWSSPCETDRILEATNAARPWFRAASWADQVAAFDEVQFAALVKP